MGLSPGDRIDRYEVIELLGRGGMGEVYRARDPKLARLVALKILHVARDPGTDGAARLLREARAAAALSHANVLAVFDVGEVQEPESLRGLAYIAMELVIGRSMRTYVGDESVPMERRVAWLRDVALALGAAHQAGIVHRDVKPENVMIRSDGAVKVLDFGIARRSARSVDEWSSMEGHSLATAGTSLEGGGLSMQTGGLAGTPLYMAPEQLLGEVLDGRADQFAWGVTAYSLLTGRLPWPGEGVSALSQILSFDPPSPRDIDPRVPALISDAIVRTLAKRRESRFDSMEDLVVALDAKPVETRPFVASTALAGNVETAQTQSGDLQREPPRRRGRALALAFAIAIALVAAGVATRRHRPDAAPVAESLSPMSSNPEATASYRAGMQAFRDASLGPAVRQLTRAVELDPLFAVAHLRLVLAKIANSWQVTAADLQPARDSRASLSERDRTLLDAIEPWALPEHPDLKESERRLQAAAQRYPSDADIAFQLVLVLDKSGQPARALRQVDAALALDPALAVALMEKGELLLELEDVQGAFDVYGQCVKVSPGTTTCVADMAAVQANEGKCDDLVATSRRLITLAPTRPEPYERLAEGLVGTGEPFDVVRAALRQRFDQELPSDRRVLELTSEAALAVLAGNFSEANRTYEDLEKLVTDPDDDTRFGLMYPRMLLALETGLTAQAIRLAGLYLHQRTAWSSGMHDYSLPTYEVQLAAGGITRTKFGELRDQWLAQNHDEAPDFRWIAAYASPAGTPELAREAMAARPEGPVVNSLFMPPDLAGAIGRTYFLAGQLEQGIRFLTAASSSCAVIDGTGAVFSTWAAFDLGTALETRGDTAGACSAYRRVLSRWGGASPPARTATKARARQAALGCAQ